MPIVAPEGNRMTCVERVERDPPVVSVVMPVWNARAFVGAAIESILNQTFAEFEFIIVNDGSTDRSLSIMKSFAKRDNRIMLISRSNTGISRARQDGLKVARGEFLASMDADDVALAFRLERQVHYMRQHRDCVLLGASVMHTDPVGNALRQELLPTEHEDIDGWLMQGRGGAIRQPVAMMRTDAARAVGGYRDEFSGTEDLDLFLRLAEYGRIANLSEVLLLYREHLGSTNHTRWKHQDVQRRRIVEEAYRRRGRSAPRLALVPYVMPSRVDQLRNWAHELMREGNVEYACRHALKALAYRPGSFASWRLLARVFSSYRGRSNWGS